MVVSGLGSERKGSQAWFQLGPFQLQPSELAKIVVIITLASLIAHFDSELDAKRLAIVLAAAGLPMALIMLQPDLGTTLVFVAVVMGMLLVGGAQVRHIAALTLIGIIGVAMVLNSGMLEKFQQCRLTSFLETQDQECAERDAAYNLEQAKTAIGSGGLTGTRALQRHPDPPRHRPRAAHRLHLHGGGRGARLHRRGHAARAAVGHRLAHLAHRPAGPRPARDAHLRRRAVDVRVPGVRERRDDHGHHAHHRASRCRS